MINYKSYSEETGSFVDVDKFDDSIESTPEFVDPNHDPMDDIEENKEPETDESTFGIVNAGSVYIRSNAGTEYDPVTTTTEGSELMVLRESGDWYNVMTSAGIEGWMMKQYLTVS